MGGHVIGALPSMGTRWPVHTTSTGKVLLAHLDDVQRDLHLGARLDAATPRTITSRAVFLKELVRVREQGYGVNDEELEMGYVGCAAAIRAADGTVIGALSVGGPTSRLGGERIHQIARQLPAHADEVSRRLGWFDPRKRLARPAVRALR
jgi:DNA-binding IclR family transcriptional regulator